MTVNKEDSKTLEKQQKEFKEWMVLVRDEWKVRRSREFVLIVTCTIILMYAYPIDVEGDSGDKIMQVIDISPLSIKIPLADAVAIFPTIIAAIYLVYLSSSSKVNAFTALAFASIGAKRTYIEDRVARATIIFAPAAVTLADPDKPFPLSSLGQLSQIVTLLFVGMVFSIIPYATMVLSIYRGWQLFEDKLLLSWNLACIAIMILAVIGQVFGTSKDRDVIY